MEDITFEVKKLVLLDSQWAKSKRMANDPRISSLPRVKLNKYNTTFWRYRHTYTNVLGLAGLECKRQ